jgi:DNA repair exonuclease SbcCD ATPase subunit
MSNQNDLDDQLYILLASMKEYREAIADDNKRLEAFYNQVASGVLDKAEKSLQETNRQAIGALKNRIQELDQATHRLNWQFIVIYSSAFVAFVMIFLLSIFLYVPSLDEIKQRRADIAELNKYPIQIRRSDDETLVRIMTKKPCYSFQPSNVENKTYDWCQIDPKKY